MTYFRKSYEPPLIFLKLKKLFFYIIFLKKNYFCTNPEMLFTIFQKKEAREREKKIFFPLSEENNLEIYWHHVRIYIWVHFLCITLVMSWIPEIGLLGNTLRNQLKSMKMKSILHHSWLMDLLVWSLFNLSDKNWNHICDFLQMKK